MINKNLVRLPFLRVRRIYYRFNRDLSRAAWLFFSFYYLPPSAFDPRELISTGLVTYYCFSVHFSIDLVLGRPSASFEAYYCSYCKVSIFHYTQCFHCIFDGGTPREILRYISIVILDGIRTSKTYFLDRFVSVENMRIFPPIRAQYFCTNENWIFNPIDFQ